MPDNLYGVASRVPAIPDPRSASLDAVVTAAKEWIEVREGARGDGLDKAVTMRDLLNSGLATPFDIRKIGGGGIQVPNIGGNSPDIPPTPTNLVASGAFKYIVLTWDFVRGYSRLAYFELWRGVTDVLAEAVLVAQPFGTIYADDVGPGKKYFYWVRAVSDAPAFSPYNSLSGTPGETALDPGYIIELLQGQIGESELNKTLGDRINLIDGPLTMAGSVAARIKGETDARVAAIQAETDDRVKAIDKEIADRLAAIAGEQQARMAYVQEYTYSKLQSDQALAIKATELRTAYEAYADTGDKKTLSTAAADVRQYAYSKADTDSAEAQQSQALTTAFQNYANGVGSAAAADVRQYAYSKSYSDAALAATTSNLTTSYKAYADTQRDTAIQTANADVRQYAYSKSSIDDAQALQSADLTTAYKNYANGIGSAAAADVRSYSYSKSDTNQAIAATANDLRAEFQNVQGASEAWVQQYAYSKAEVDQAQAGLSSTLTTNYTNAITAAQAAAVQTASADVRNYAYSKAASDGALASVTQTLQTSINGNSAAIQQNSVSIDGMKLQYTLRLDNNGYVSGWGIASEPYNGVPRSIMIVRADSFSIGSPSGPGIPPSIPFIVRTTVSTINGVTVPVGTYIADAYIANGSISNAKIGNLQVDDAKIANLAVAKLRAGAISVSEYIESSNYAGGQSGWRIHGNGDPEFRNGIFRGTIYATAGLIGGNLLADESVTNQKIATKTITASRISVGSADQVVPDADMLDATWWGRPEYSFSTPANSDYWQSRRILSFGPAPYSDTFSLLFPVVRGGQYLFEFQVFLTDDYKGPSAVYAHLVGQEWFQVGIESRGYTFEQAGIPGGDKNLVTFDENSVKGTRQARGIRTIANTNGAGQVQFRIITNVTQGVIQFGGFRVTRIMDEVLIQDGAVTANKLNVGRANGSLEGVEINKYGGKTFDPSGVKRFQWGNLDV